MRLTNNYFCIILLHAWFTNEEEQNENVKQSVQFQVSMIKEMHVNTQIHKSGYFILTAICL